MISCTAVVSFKTTSSAAMLRRICTRLPFSAAAAAALARSAPSSASNVWGQVPRGRGVILSERHRFLLQRQEEGGPTLSRRGAFRDSPRGSGQRRLAPPPRLSTRGRQLLPKPRLALLRLKSKTGGGAPERIDCDVLSDRCWLQLTSRLGTRRLWIDNLSRRKLVTGVKDQDKQNVMVQHLQR